MSRRGLTRRQQRLPQQLGVDETSFQRHHEYVTVVMDQQEGTVAHIADGRGQDTLDAFLAAFSPEVARMVKRHLEGILNAIVLGVTTARAERPFGNAWWTSAYRQ